MSINQTHDYEEGDTIDLDNTVIDDLFPRAQEKHLYGLRNSGSLTNYQGHDNQID